MEKLSKGVAKKISIELDLNEDQKEVLAYGAFAVMQTLLAVVLVIILGALFDIVIEAVMISVTIGVLRRYSGGVHASSPSICNFVGTIIAIGQAVLISKIQSHLAVNLTILIGFVIFPWAYFLVYKLAPVDSDTKIIKSLQKKRRLKKASLLTLSSYLMIVLAISVISVIINSDTYLVYVLCIYAGVVWQVFTLTRVGHIIMSKVDTFLSHILKLVKGGDLR